MVDLAGTLICIVLGFSFLLPFLTDCGIMEFLGIIARPVVEPLFKVPGRASVDLIASWFGASNAAVILTREQYTYIEKMQAFRKAIEDGDEEAVRRLIEDANRIRRIIR